jgi:hypothetical protein
LLGSSSEKITLVSRELANRPMGGSTPHPNIFLRDVRDLKILNGCTGFQSRD